MTKATAEEKAREKEEKRPKTFGSLRKVYGEHHADPKKSLAEYQAWWADEENSGPAPGCSCLVCVEYRDRAPAEEDTDL